MEQVLCDMRVAVVVADGFDDQQMMAVKETLVLSGAAAFLLSSTGTTVRAGAASEVGNTGFDSTAPAFAEAADKAEARHGAAFATDGDLVNCDPAEYDAAFVPGGKESIEALRTNAQAVSFLQGLDKAGKPIAAGGEAIQLLTEAGLKGSATGSGPELSQAVIAAFTVCWEDKGAGKGGRKERPGDTLAGDEQGLSGGR